MKRSTRMYITTFITFIVVLVILVLNSVTLLGITKSSEVISDEVEELVRSQARSKLRRVRDKLILDEERDLVNFKDMDSLITWFNNNYAGTQNLSMKNSDGFVIELGQELFLLNENKHDIKRLHRVGEDEVTKISSSLPGSVSKELLNDLESTKDSDEYSKVTWVDNNEIIYVEHVVVPGGHLGFGNQYPRDSKGNENKDYSKLIIGLTSTKSDADKIYSKSLSTLDSLSSLVFVSTLASIVTIISLLLVTIHLVFSTKSYYDDLVRDKINRMKLSTKRM